MLGLDFDKLTRWGVPGWIATLSFIGFIIIDQVLSFSPVISEPIRVLTELSNADGLITAIVVAAAGVPFGYLIYQVYFFIRWNSPLSRDGLMPPFIVGRNQDLDRTLRDLKEEDLTGKHVWRKNWYNHELTQRDHGWRWRYIELLFFEVSQRVEIQANGLFARDRYLLDILHTLGSSLLAIYTGMGGYLLLKRFTQSLSLFWLFFFLIILLVILLFLLDIEDNARKNLEVPYNIRRKLKISDPVYGMVHKPVDTLITK